MVDRRSLTRRESADPALTMWRGALIGSELPSVTGGIRTAGVDLTDRAKLVAARHRWKGALEARIFSAEERDRLQLDDDAVFCAAFGIKESVIKVLGGLPRGAGFQDIRLDRTDLGWGVGLRGRAAVFRCRDISRADGLRRPGMAGHATAGLGRRDDQKRGLNVDAPRLGPGSVFLFPGSGQPASGYGPRASGVPSIGSSHCDAGRRTG